LRVSGEDGRKFEEWGKGERKNKAVKEFQAVVRARKK